MSSWASPLEIWNSFLVFCKRSAFKSHLLALSFKQTLRASPTNSISTDRNSRLASLQPFLSESRPTQAVVAKHPHLTRRLSICPKAAKLGQHQPPILSWPTLFEPVRGKHFPPMVAAEHYQPLSKTASDSRHPHTHTHPARHCFSRRSSPASISVFRGTACRVRPRPIPRAPKRVQQPASQPLIHVGAAAQPGLLWRQCPIFFSSALRCIFLR
ncbi:uncharacterized protein J3D65DRAFT_454306 [Phyllosticta citribraziliensis]|uniref:Uncharacterized protein n=1 Tax=Phyllosticta citribraziliensis TaxID=989973 RepID=A0ABR1LEV2_9PEZI